MRCAVAIAMTETSKKRDHVAPSDEGRSAAGLACASGDEMVSLGFRVGNPLAIGWHWGRIFQHLLPVAVTPTTSRRIATRGLRRKMAGSPS